MIATLASPPAALQARTPRPRCWLCGTTEVASLCCRCHRFLCGRHDGVADLSRLRGFLHPFRRWPESPVGAGRDDPNSNSNSSKNSGVGVGDGGDSGRGGDGDKGGKGGDGRKGGDGGKDEGQTVPASNPDPGAPKRISERHFCRDCMPLGRPHDPEMIAATVVVLLGVLVSVWSPVAGGVLIAVGVVRIALRVVAGERRRRAGRRHPTALFLDPRVTELALLETMSGHAYLDPDYRYRREETCQGTRVKTEVHGVINTKAVWARAHTVRVAQHRLRYRIPESHGLQISSGALVVRGPARLTLRPPREVGRLTHPTAVLLEPATGDHPVLRSPDGRGDPRWTFAIEYDVTPPERGWTMPVWLTPAISPGSDRRALDLDVQWRTREPGVDTVAAESVLESKKIESLRIYVPATWGEVQSYSRAERVIVSVPSDGWRSIEWQEPKIERSSLGLCHLSVAFERRIDPSDSVTGELDMRFHGTLSGAKLVQVHAAGGARRRDGARCTASTRVKLGFDLSLAKVRYQDVRAVPDPVRDGEKTRPERKTFDDIVPDHHTVAQLTDILSREGYYVKRVVENPAQPGRNAAVLNRSWDIAGRRYNGLHPIDFHLVISGEEVQDGPATPTTTVRLTVRGTYATSEMEDQIVHEQELLWKRIVSTLESGNDRVAGGEPREADEPVDAASAELARLRNVALTLRTRLEAAQRTGDMTSRLAAEVVSQIDEEFGLGGPGAQA
jgi:hypothetical protein